MAEDTSNRGRCYTTVSDVSVRRGASEKPLGRQVPMEEQKASRKFLRNEQNPRAPNRKRILIHRQASPTKTPDAACSARPANCPKGGAFERTDFAKEQMNNAQEPITNLAEDLERFFEADGQWHLWQPSIGNSALDTQRMTMQQSVFPFGMPEVEPGMIEREILIPEGHKETLRQELGVMGISDQTLFSDLAGFFERNTTQSSYDRELAADYYTKEIRKAEGQGYE